MKWVEIITLRSPENINVQFLDAILGQITNFDNPKNLIELKIYYHSVVETDLSIHLHWKSEPGSQHHKSPLGLKFSYALRSLGLLNHSVWVETPADEAPMISRNATSQDMTTRETKGSALEIGAKTVDKEGF